MGCFRPGRSDVDVIVVVARPLAARERDALGRRLLDLTLPGPLELSVLTAPAASAARYPMPYELHVGDTRVVVDQGEGDLDLAAHVTATVARGFTLVGPPPAEVFGPVPWGDFLAAITDDLVWGFEHGSVSYAVLNACRVLQTLASPDGTVVSKEEGAAWALEQLPAEHHPLIAACLAYRVDGTSIDVGAEAVNHFRELAVIAAGQS